jgi:hypothetical protein
MPRLIDRLVGLMQYVITHSTIEFDIMLEINRQQLVINQSLNETKDIATEILEIIKK